MSLINAAEIVGKDLFAERTVKAYNLPDEPHQVIATFSAGDRVGTVSSFVMRNEQVWWQIGQNMWVKHEQGLFDLEAIQDQGGETTADRLKRQEREGQLLTAGLLERIYLETKWGFQDNKTLQIAGYIILAAIVVAVVVKAAKVADINIKSMKKLKFS